MYTTFIKIVIINNHNTMNWVRQKGKRKEERGRGRKGGRKRRREGEREGGKERTRDRRMQSRREKRNEEGERERERENAGKERGSTGHNNTLNYFFFCSVSGSMNPTEMATTTHSRKLIKLGNQLGCLGDSVGRVTALKAFT